MNHRALSLAVLGSLALASGCGYNIVPEPPKDMPRAEGKSLPLRVAVRDAAREGSQQTDAAAADKLAAALRQSSLFADVQRVGAGAVPGGFDAIVQAAYKDTTDPGMIGFVFPPCLIPFVDLCIIPLGHVNIDIGAELNVSVVDPDGQAIKTYSEKASGVCSYLPFPGLFPFNLALIGPETHCHQEEGPAAAFQMAVAKLVEDLVKDRAVFAGHRRAAPAEAESGAAETPAAASGEKPWWK